MVTVPDLHRRSMVTCWKHMFSSFSQFIRKEGQLKKHDNVCYHASPCIQRPAWLLEHCAVRYVQPWPRPRCMIALLPSWCFLHCKYPKAASRQLDFQWRILNWSDQFPEIFVIWPSRILEVCWPLGKERFWNICSSFLQQNNLGAHHSREPAVRYVQQSDALDELCWSRSTV